MTDRSEFGDWIHGTVRPALQAAITDGRIEGEERRWVRDLLSDLTAVVPTDRRRRLGGGFVHDGSVTWPQLIGRWLRGTVHAFDVLEPLDQVLVGMLANGIPWRDARHAIAVALS